MAIKLLGFVLIVSLSGIMGASIGVHLGPLELSVLEVSTACSVLGCSLALLACGPILGHLETKRRNDALVRSVERRMNHLSQLSSRQH